MRRFLFGILGFLIAIVAAAWLTLKRDDIPYAELEERYAFQASKFVALENGVRAHYLDVGPRETDKTLFMVHGFSASIHTWADWIRMLEDDYRIIAVDLPVHGLTEAPADYIPSIEAFVEHVETVAATLELDTFVLIGSSMGGNTSWQYARKHPERLDGLVLVGASGWPETENDAENEPLIFKLISNPVLGPILQKIDMTDQIRKGLEASFVDDMLVTDEMVQRYTDLARAPGHRKGLFDIMMGERDLATDEKLSVISAPTLVLHGDKDNLVPVRFAELYENAIPDVRAIIYEGVGHLPQEEIPNGSIADLKTFLDEVFMPTPNTDDQALETAEH